MGPDMIIIPHILLKTGDTIRIPQPQWDDILAEVLDLNEGALRVLIEWKSFIFHWGFFVQKEDWSYLPYQID